MQKHGFQIGFCNRNIGDHGTRFGDFSDDLRQEAPRIIDYQTEPLILHGSFDDAVESPQRR